MVYVYAPHKPDAEKLHRVATEMLSRGAPTIRAWWAGDYWLALEGSHRLAAAHALGLTPVIVPMSLEDEMAHDFEDVESRTVVALVQYVSDPLGPGYGFENLDREFDHAPIPPTPRDPRAPPSHGRPRRLRRLPRARRIPAGVRGRRRRPGPPTAVVARPTCSIHRADARPGATAGRTDEGRQRQADEAHAGVDRVGV